MQLVPITTTDEVELAILAMRISWQNQELHVLQQQLTPLEAAFAAFEQRVATQTGDLTRERDRLRQTCAELERYTTRIHARLAADPDGLLNAVFSPEELRDIGRLCGVDVPDSWFEPMSHATTSGAGWSFADDPPAQPHAVANSETADDLRSLYRQLAKTFHPDLTDNERERHFRQDLMFRINQAWHERDLISMRAIRAEVGDLLSGSLTSVTGYRLAWYRRELARLESACRTCQARITALRSSRTVALWHNPVLARSAITRHQARLELEISELELRRTSAVEEFRHALGAYTAQR